MNYEDFMFFTSDFDDTPESRDNPLNYPYAEYRTVNELECLADVFGLDSLTAVLDSVSSLTSEV